MHKSIPAICALVLALGACTTSRDAHGAQNDSNEGQTLLGDDELKALLREVIVGERQSPVFVSHPLSEIFDQRGVYFRTDGRVTREGTFYIANKQVCVEGADITRRCRNVYRNHDGTYTLVDTADGSAQIRTITTRS